MQLAFGVDVADEEVGAGLATFHEILFDVGDPKVAFAIGEIGAEFAVVTAVKSPALGMRRSTKYLDTTRVFHLSQSIHLSLEYLLLSQNYDYHRETPAAVTPQGWNRTGSGIIPP